MAEASGFHSLLDDEFQDPEDGDDFDSRTTEELENELLSSARNGNLSQVSRILDVHSLNSEALNINCKGKQKANMGWTAIHLASYFGHADVTAALIEYGVDVNVQNDCGDTPLHKAAYIGREDMVTLLIRHGADVGIINCEGHQAKHVARSESIKKLIEATQSYETKKTEDDFLRYARDGNVDAITDMLKQHKLSHISCTDRFGNSALHCAAYRGRKEVAVLLIQNGIDTSLRNAKGHTAEDLARDSQMKKLLSVSPIKPQQREIPRFEGPLLKRAGVFGWRPVWVVLERGVLSIYRNRADGSTGSKRRGFRYLDEATVKVPKNGVHLIELRLGDSSTITFSVEMDISVHINRQKWITALEEHISYSKQWSQEGATVSDEENDEQEVMPLGSIQDVIQNAQAHQQLMERHISTVTEKIDDVTSQTTKEAPEIMLAKLQTDLHQLKESSREMIDAMNRAITILTQQDKVRNVQLHQECEKGRVLQEALRVLAEEHHHLEQSIRSQSPCHSMIDSGDEEDEFHDCIEDSFSNSGRDTNLTNDKTVNGSQTVKSSCSIWGGRTQLPAPMFSRSDFSVWSILKQCIGKELSKITMPVIFNEPLSFLQRVVEYMEYSDLLVKASDCDDPIKRLEYVAAFATSATASNWERIGKPFNPLLGETYELNREDLGFKIVCEQVSHHPPVSAFHVTSPLFSLHGAIHPKLKFWGKSIEVTPKGLLTLTLHRHNEVFTWQYVNCCIHNIIVGKIWIEHYGSMEIFNLNTKHKVSLNFKPSGWFSKELHKVEGFLFDSNKKKIKAFYGKWIEALYSCDVAVWERHSKDNKKDKSPAEQRTTSEHATPPGEEDKDDPPPALVKGSACDLRLQGQQLLWQATPKPSHSNKYYSFTDFAIMLNELHESESSALPPTDCRFRPDMRKMEEGDIDGASAEKNRIEEKQRSARKERKKRKEEWKPKWFRQGVNPHTGKEDWIFGEEYWDRKYASCPDIF